MSNQKQPLASDIPKIAEDIATRPDSKARQAKVKKCPSCNSMEVSAFYQTEHVPVQSCVLMNSQTDARAYPRGNILLGFCRECGFISNLLFDASKMDYSLDYEETQHFSKTFTDYAEKLIEKLISDYGIRQKTVLEIGCGKASFLAMLCLAGNNRGIGIDPACRPERIPQDADITIILDNYGKKYSHLAADLICCRHTLEHIWTTRKFLETIHESVADRDTLLFFEVPDVRRILKEQAFWDVYYEHCSYFSAGSLARLFRSCGFEIHELSRDYDDQYLWIIASSAKTIAKKPAQSDLEDDLSELERATVAFRQGQNETMDLWKRRLAKQAEQGLRTVLWGASSKTVAFLARLPESNIEYVVDINPHKHGQYLPGTGHRIVGPEFLTEHPPDLVVAMNPIYLDEIKSDLRRRSIDSEVVAV